MTFAGPVGELDGDDGIDDLGGAVCDKGEELVGSVHLVGAIVRVRVQAGETCSVVGDDDGDSLMDGGTVDVRVVLVWVGDRVVDREPADAVLAHGVHQSVADCVDLSGWGQGESLAAVVYRFGEDVLGPVECPRSDGFGRD